MTEFIQGLLRFRRGPWEMLATIIIAVLGALLIFGCDAARASFHAFMSIFSNHGYMGIPVFLAAFGPEGALPPILSSLAGGIPSMVLIMVALELLRAGAIGNLARGLSGMFVRNPLFIATVLGIVFSMFELPVPRSADTLMDMLSATAGPDRSRSACGKPMKTRQASYLSYFM